MASSSSSSSSSSYNLKTLIIFLVITTKFKVNAEFVLYSEPSQVMLPGQNLSYDLTYKLLPFGPHELVFQSDCNLIRYTRGIKTWESQTTTHDGDSCTLRLLPDGELILSGRDLKPYWRSGIKSTRGNYAFVLEFDSTISIFGPKLWSNTKKVTMSESEPMLLTTDYVAYSHQVTTYTFGIVLSYKNFRLVLREDCNLVLEDINTWDILWETKTSSPYGDCFTLLDDHGEFFIMHNRRDVLWRTGVRSKEPANYPNSQAIMLRYDGRLMIYNQKIWSLPVPVSQSIATSELGSTVKYCEQ